MFNTRFLSPTESESSTYWQFFYIRPPGKLRYTAVEMAKTPHIYIYKTICTWIMGASSLKLILIISSTWDCTTFHSFNVKKRFLKVSRSVIGWLMVNRIGMYGSQVAECVIGVPISVLLNAASKRTAATRSYYHVLGYSMKSKLWNYWCFFSHNNDSASRMIAQLHHLYQHGYFIYYDCIVKDGNKSLL